jgi:hypothetical protein
MYTLVRNTSQRELLVQQAPALGSALVIAELFYHFHSFTLEAAAMLATWTAVDAVISRVRRARERATV